MTPAESRHARLYLDLARRGRTDTATLLHWLGSIRRAWQFAESDDNLTLEFVWAMEDFFRLQGLGRDHIEWATRGIRAAEGLNDLRAKGILLNNMGWTLAQVGETEKALNAYNEALVIQQARRDPGEESAIRHNIGLIVLERQGRTTVAREQFERAVVLARDASDWNGEAKVLSSLSKLEGAAGNTEGEFALLDKVLQIYTSHEDLEGEATTLNYRGVRFAEVGRIDDARNSYERSLALRMQIGDRRGVAESIDNLGVLRFENGDYDSALAYYHRALEIEEATGDMVGIHATLNNIGVVYGDWDEPAKALSYYTRALSVADAMGSRVARAATLTSMALPEAAVGGCGRAVAWLEEALAIHIETEDLGWQAATLHNLGLIARKYRSDPRRAIEFFERALDINRRIWAKGAERNTLSAMAAAYEDLGQYEVAERLLDMVVKADEQLGNSELEDDRAHLECIRCAQKTKD